MPSERKSIFIREVDGRFHVDAQPGEALHQLLNLAGELPLQECMALRAACLLLEASMRSAMASAWARSSLSLRKARSLKLARAGGADAVDLQDAADQHVENDRAAMAPAAPARLRR